MSNEYNYGQKGVSTDLQFGKRGPRLVANASTSALQVTLANGSTLSNLRIANAVIDTDAVTKAQLDASLSNVSTNAFNISLGNVSAEGDGDWFITPDQGIYDGNTSVKREGAISLTNNTSVAESIDILNETMWNIQNNTYVRDVSFTTDKTSGGNPLTATLTINVTGNANQYDIDWGDGTTTLATSDSTPTHTYSNNANSPYTVEVTARNTNGAGSGSEASHSETSFITLYTATPVADFDLYNVSSSGSVLSGNDLYLVQGNTVYLENTTTNSASATCTYSVDWGDGSSPVLIGSGNAGDVGQARISHTYNTNSGSGTFTITLTQISHSTADPSDAGSTATQSIKIYAITPTTPDGLSSKTLTFGESSTGSSPYLVSGFTDKSTESTLTAGSSVTRITGSSAGGTISSGTTSTYAIDADSGELQAILNGNSVIGNVTFTSGNESGNYSRTGAFNGLTVAAESDYQLLSSSGAGTTFSSSTYYPGAFKGFRASMYLTTSIYQNDEGVYTFKLAHSTTGNTNVVEFLIDDLTSSAVVNMSNVTVTENSAGTLRYVSGIPYYTNDATIDLSGIAVYNWMSQAYRNDSAPFDITNGTNQEGTSGTVIGTQSYSYADIDNSTNSFLSGGIPVANTGKDSGNAYTLGNITVNVNGGGIGIEQLKAKLDNVNGTGNYTELNAKYFQAWNGNTGINENSIAVSDSLGATHDDDGLRITGFSSATDTPTFNNSVNNYTANVWSGAETIAGTAEAVDRFGIIKHFTTDLSSTAYFPQGPDLATGRSGAQYFTFAFRRSTMANFDITLSGTISGLWIAAPGTNIDSASGLNGWLAADTTYGGSGTPGSNTGSGGNGSDGCAFTSGDRIIDGTTYSNSSFTMTLGDQNASNSIGNTVLVRIKLESGDSLTALSIS